MPQQMADVAAATESTARRFGQIFQGATDRCPHRFSCNKTCHSFYVCLPTDFIRCSFFFFFYPQGDDKQAARFMSRANEIWEKAYAQPVASERDGAGSWGPRDGS